MNEDGTVVVHADEAPGWAVRLEAKLDVALAQHGARIVRVEDRVSNVDSRLKRFEDDPRISPEAFQDHEARLRVQEAKNTVSPRALGTVVLGVLGAIGALYPFLDRFYA